MIEKNSDSLIHVLITNGFNLWHGTHIIYFIPAKVMRVYIPRGKLIPPREIVTHNVTLDEFKQYLFDKSLEDYYEIYGTTHGFELKVEPKLNENIFE